MFVNIDNQRRVLGMCSARSRAGLLYSALYNFG